MKKNPMSDRPHLSPALAGATVVDTPVLGRVVETHRRISWAAIFDGVILVVIVQVLLSLLGAGLGLGTVNVNAGTTPNASSFGIGGGIWWVISSALPSSSAGMSRPGLPAWGSALTA